MMAKGLRGARVMQSLPESHVQFYAAEVLLALEEMHSFGLVYRDLKPEVRAAAGQGGAGAGHGCDTARRGSGLRRPASWRRDFV
jgi:hypothetical protein